MLTAVLLLLRRVSWQWSALFEIEHLVRVEKGEETNPCNIWQHP